MATVITPSRADLLPIHNLYGPLQPSAMPAPPPSVSPHHPAPYPFHPKLSRSHLDKIGTSSQNEIIARWKTDLIPGNERERLATRDPNLPSPSSKRAVTVKSPNVNSILVENQPPQSIRSKNQISFANSVPKRPIIPDVFADSSQKQINPLPNSAKRLRETTPTLDILGDKRVKLDLANRPKKSLEETAKWETKWRKAFPGLVFHFEVGADDARKTLTQRVERMGAVGPLTEMLIPES
jgi:hypothetical protein